MRHMLRKMVESVKRRKLVCESYWAVPQGQDSNVNGLGIHPVIHVVGVMRMLIAIGLAVAYQQKQSGKKQPEVRMGLLILEK